MQAQAFRQLNEQDQITLTQSQVAVRTLLSASFGCILFLRSLLPEENFGQTHLVVGDNRGSFNSETPASSQTSGYEGGSRTSRYKIMTVKRGFSLEGDEILDYLEKGAFDALEKQYLKRMIFALYIDKEDPQNIVEAWNFDFTYHQVPGTNLRLPMMSMSDSNVGAYQSSVNSLVQTANEVRAPTLGEVKGSIRNMVHKLIAITQTLEDLPKKRFATFKLEYYPHTPDEYEPPLFVAGDPGRSKLTLATHDVTEPPTRVNVGKLDAGFSSVSLEVHSVAGALPTTGNDEDRLHVLGAAPQATNGIAPRANTFGENMDSLSLDASKRNILWDAEIRVTTHHNHTSGAQEQMVGLIGQRMNNGEVAAVGNSFSGKVRAPVLHVDLMGETQSSQREETQANESTVATSPIIPRPSPARSMSTLTQVSDRGDVEPDFADTMGRLNLAGHASTPHRSQSPSEDVMDLETQQVLASWTSEQTVGASIPRNIEAFPPNAEKPVPKIVTRMDEDPISEYDGAIADMEVEVSCDCAIKKDAEDYDICQCDGPCGRWVHLWCHGYHGSNDSRLPESFRCFECRLRGTQASVVKGETLIREYVLKYAELALFRRALKIIEVENPSNATEFRKAVGCNPPVAAQLWKRLESEGFVGPENVEEDGIGMFESRSMVPRKAGKSKIRKTAKTRYIKNPLLSKMIAAYFDPSEEAERQHVGLGRKHQARERVAPQKKRALQEPSQIQLAHLTTDLPRVPLFPSSVYNSSQEIPQVARKVLSSDQPATLMMDVDHSSLSHKSPAKQTVTPNGKRKAMALGSNETADGLNLRRSKRIKVSVPQKNVDLDWILLSVTYRKILLSTPCLLSVGKEPGGSTDKPRFPPLSAKEMSTSRVPRPRTSSATPQRKTTAAQATPTTPSRPTRGLVPPTLKTKVSAPKLKPAAASSRAKSPISPASDGRSSPASSHGGLSIKEQIALRRAEQLKKASSTKSNNVLDEQSPIDIVTPTAEEDILGRWSIRDTIDRAKSSGSIVLNSRDLTRIPSYLFESHLAVTPEPLKDAPPEVVEPEAPSKIKRSGSTAWYEQVDLTTLKLWHNSIVELQPELSLFGSLKILDLHKNQLKRLPESFSDLIFLTYVDLSENELEVLPDGISSFPQLATLNVSHNKLQCIPFQINTSTSSRSRSESFFSSTLDRATVPLPSLRILLASHNQFSMESFQLSHIPRQIVEFDLSHNQLSPIGPLFSHLSALDHLQKLRLNTCGLKSESFPANLSKFVAIKLLDLGENDELSEDTVRRALGEREMEIGHANHQFTTGGLQVIFGKPAPAREAWEVEAENRVRLRKKSTTTATSADNPFTIGNYDVPPVPSPQRTPTATLKVKTEEPVKEAWEIEAEQGLLTEGGRRRARAAAAAAAAASPTQSTTRNVVDLSSPIASSPPVSEMNNVSLGSPPRGTSSTPSLVQFYDGPHATLTLPRSQPQARTHNRSFSVASTPMSANTSDLVVPRPTMPLPTILSQSFANSIKVLILSNRRLESSIILPSSRLSSPLLPHLDELSLDNCNLSSEVPTLIDGGSASPARNSLLDIIAALFPSLSTLDLSYNLLTTLSGIGILMTPDPEKKRKGLTTLRLRGNRLSSLDPLEELGATWKSGGGIEGWRGEEIDLRDNEIGKLPPLLGLLPLDVLLVEGNTFRVPARRVWEREGTKGLLKWLAERI